MFTKEELIKMLNQLGVEYDMDSLTPGIQYEDGSFETYAEIQLPSEYWGDKNGNKKFYDRFNI